jgi:predicted ATPase
MLSEQFQGAAVVAECTKALLAVDLVDSTALGEQLGETAMAQLWEAHDRLARDAIRRSSGLEIGRSDGFLAVFDRSSDALACASEYHTRLSALWPGLRARAAVHSGTVRLRSNAPEDVELGATPFELDGQALPIVMRLLSIAQEGQTLATAAAASESGAAEAVSHGHWRLKGLAEPLELIEVAWSGVFGLPPPDAPKGYRVVRDSQGWRPARAVPHSLPAEPDLFVGRQAALASLARQFDADARLVTLLGPGGIGKTRLALHFARSWLGDWPGGAWFCDLSGATTPDGLLLAVAQGLGLALQKGDPGDQIGAAIQARGECLLLLDNAEQVLEPLRELVARWLQKLPAARLLVTSRTVLGLAGEHLLDLDPLVQTDAVALFECRAAAAGAAPQAADRPEVGALVELLDRLPLAIELAAARARVMPVEQMRAQVHARFRLLARGGPASGRHATLRAALDWSWDLLAPAQRRDLAQLSVFEGGFDLAAAEAVLVAENGDAGWIVDRLQALVDQSLLRRAANGRFELLRSVQDYAAERLAVDPSAAAAVEQRHGAHYAGLDEFSPTGLAVADLDNLVAACRRATQRADAAIAIGALELAAALLHLTGPISAMGDLAQAVAALPALDDRQRAALARVRGNAQRALGQPAEAIETYRSGLEAARRAGDRRLAVRLSCALAESLTRAGERGQAQGLLDAAESMAQALGELPIRLIVMAAHGQLAIEAARYEQASERFSEAVRLARAMRHGR